MSKANQEVADVAQTETAANPRMNRREMMVLTGAVVGSATLGAGTTTVAASDTLDYEGDLAHDPTASGSITIEDIDDDLLELELFDEIEDGDDEIVDLYDYGFALEAREDDEPNNPVEYAPSDLDTEQFDAIDWRESVDWTGDADSSGDAIVVDGSATLEINVDGLEASDALVQLIADPGVDSTIEVDDEGPIELPEGDDVILQEPIAVEAVDEITVDGSVTIHALGVSDDEWTFGLEETESDTTEITESDGGSLTITSLEDLFDGFDDVTLESVIYHVERAASELPASQILVTDTDLNDDGSEIRAEIATIFDEPDYSAITSIDLEDLNDEIVLESDAYREVGYAADAGTVDDWDDVDDLDLSDATSDFESGSEGDSIALIEGAVDGTTVVYYDVEVSDEQFGDMTTTAGGGGLLGSGGLSWAWSLVVGGIVGLGAHVARVRGWFGNLLG